MMGSTGGETKKKKMGGFAEFLLFLFVLSFFFSFLVKILLSRVFKLHTLYNSANQMPHKL